MLEKGKKKRGKKRGRIFAENNKYKLTPQWALAFILRKIKYYTNLLAELGFSLYRVLLLIRLFKLQYNIVCANGLNF